MIVRKSVRWAVLIEKRWLTLLGMTLYAVGVVFAYEREYIGVTVPIAIASMLGIGLSVLLAFKTDAAYDRWWEARKAWGAIVNDSRSFARQVLSLFSTEDGSPNALQKELIRRQIGCN
jgi:putative membrane protein